MTPPPRKPYLPKPRWNPAVPSFTLFQCSLLVFFAFFFASMFIPGFPRYITWLGLLVVSIPLWIIVIRDGGMFKRNVRRIRELNGRVCLWCLYDLSALPPDGRCPECSTHYEDDDLRAYWRTTTK